MAVDALCMKETSWRLYSGTATRRFNSKVTHGQMETPATCSPWVVCADWSRASTQKPLIQASSVCWVRLETATDPRLT